MFQLLEEAARSSRETFTEDRRHDMEKRLGQRPGSIVIVGCGRFGALLESHLSRSGSRVVVIDRDRDSFSLFEVGFSGFCVTGDAVEHDVLREAGLSPITSDARASVPPPDGAFIRLNCWQFREHALFLEIFDRGSC